MCLQIEAGTVEHIQVEVSSANDSIYMCFTSTYSRYIILILLLNPRGFLFYLIPSECMV